MSIIGSIGQNHIDNFFKLAETTLNFVGYMPSYTVKTPLRMSTMESLKQGAAAARCHLGIAQAIGAIAVTCFAAYRFITTGDEASRQWALKSAEYIIHGALNIGRSYLEESDWGAALLAYDLYNRPLLSYSAAAPKYDLTGRAFTFIKSKLDAIEIEKIIPRFIGSFVKA